MLLCDRCKKPIVGESKKLLDVCPDCYNQVMSYISTGNPNVGVKRARLVRRLGGGFSPARVLAVVVVLIVLLSLSTYYAYSTYNQYEAPLIGERALVSSLEGNVTQEQQTVQTAATLILKYKSQNANLTSQVASLNQTVVNDRGNISVLQGNVTALMAQSASLQSTVSMLKENLTQLQNVARTFVIWNAAVNLSAGYYLFETVPDTFAYHDNFTSTAPVDVFYFNSTQFVQWYARQSISGSYVNYTNTTHQSDTFTLGEGCGGYVVIYLFTTAGTIHPNVSATYAPAQEPTGSCGSTP